MLLTPYLTPPPPWQPQARLPHLSSYFPLPPIPQALLLPSSTCDQFLPLSLLVWMSFAKSLPLSLFYPSLGNRGIREPVSYSQECKNEHCQRLAVFLAEYTVKCYPFNKQNTFLDFFFPRARWPLIKHSSEAETALAFSG